jgi:hypothetical protein
VSGGAQGLPLRTNLIGALAKTTGIASSQVSDSKASATMRAAGPVPQPADSIARGFDHDDDHVVVFIEIDFCEIRATGE